MDDPPAVALHTTSLIYPSTPTPRARMFLPGADALWRWIHYNRRVIFYKTQLGDYPSIVHGLKSSLSFALVQFYPWAGRLVEDENGRLEVDCNDAGVEFVEASVDISFNSLEEDNFQPKPFFKDLARMDDQSSCDIFKLPLLSVQVTRFLGGEIALGCAQSHVIADGHSFWHFMNSWAECARGEPMSVLPVHMREALKSEDFPAEDEGTNGDDTFESLTERLQLSNPKPESPKAKLDTENGSTELTQKVFHFSAEQIKKLKTMSAHDGKGPYTSFEVLCAHFWRHVTAARRPPASAQKVGLAILINFRARLVPPLPIAYFGNAITGELVTATAAELAAEPLVESAARIHRQIVGTDNAKVRGTLRKVEGLKQGDLSGWGGEDMQVMNVASSPRFPVYDMDFGSGRPASVRSVRVVGDGEMVLFAGVEGGGSVDVCIALSPSAMANLQHNPHFLSF